MGEWNHEENVKRLFLRADCDGEGEPRMNTDGHGLKPNVEDGGAHLCFSDALLRRSVSHRGHGAHGGLLCTSVTL